MGVTEYLSEIDTLLQNPPADFVFSTQDIEEIVRGENLRDHLVTINKGLYLNKFLASLEWCLTLGNAAVQVGYETSSDSPQFIGHGSDPKNEIHDRLEEILRLYKTAQYARDLAGAIGPDPTGLFLVMSYWELRKYVLKLAQHYHPEADFSLVLKAA